MSSLNRIILIGRLTKDPELRYTPNGKAVANFTLAVDRRFPNQQGEREADFIRIVTWGKQAENCSNFLFKGNLAAVDGRLQIRSYDDREGQRRSISEVIADNVQFLEPKTSRSSTAENYSSNEEEMTFNDSDVPF